MNEARTAVAVCAHPDDLEFFCGGSIRKMADEGWQISLIIATDGDRGSHDPASSRHLYASTRREECRAAAWLLGLASMEFLGHEDGDLQNVRHLRAELTRLYRILKPEVLITFDPWKRYELHPDHREIGLAALDARLQARLPHFHPDQLRDGLDPWTITDIVLFNTDEADYFIDISATFDAKLEALRAHTSQWESIWPQTVAAVRTMAESTARLAGEGIHLAEGFKRLHVPLGPVSAGWGQSSHPAD
jgi:LmbE family N-acetylglucosaminyl deacetylase